MSATIRRKMQSYFGIVALFLLILTLAGLACDSAPGQKSWNASAQATSEGARGEARGKRLAPLRTIQRAELRAQGGVIDGDTVRAVGFDQSIRLLCLDAEELFDEGQEARARTDWQAYQEEEKGEAEHPVSYGTFLGEEAKEFAEEFFADHEEIFVEYQSPRRTRDFYGRHLAYIWVRDGEEGPWRNYNLEAVRAGMSPYFTSFGRCDEYHDEFVAAQEEARRAGRGIWAAGAKGYDDYEVRQAEWEARAKQIALYREHFRDHPAVVELGTDTAMARLRLSIGQRLTVFGALVRYSPQGRPPKLYMQHRHREDLIAVAAEGFSFDAFSVELKPGEFYYVEGEVEMYRGNPQLRVDGNSFIRNGSTPPPLPRR